MRSFLCVNGKVACAPFDRTSVEMKESGGVVTIKQKWELACSEVVFGYRGRDGSGYAPGDVVYLRGEDRLSSWAKDVFEVRGRRFILVPEERVLVVERDEGAADG